MAPIRFVWALLLSPVASGAAAIYLAVEALVNEQKRSVVGILAAAAFLAASSIVNFIRDQSLARKMTKINVRINQLLTSLIGSLGEICGENYQCWKTELFTAHWHSMWTLRWPWFMRKVLVRQASVSIVSTMALHDSSVLEDGPIGLCFAEQNQEVWLNPDAGITANPADIYSRMSSVINAQLHSECGAMRTAPVTNHLDADCIGVLAIHVEPQFGPLLGGTVLTDQCAGRLRTAAIDLYEIVRG
jgi:hypothetical protein